jgi:16S rRNA (guanine1516-N2)-methyltransferase
VIPLAVTVTSKQRGRQLPAAKAKAEEWGLPFFSFDRAEGIPLQERIGTIAHAFLVLGGDGWTLHDAHGSLYFSPGTAALRVRRIGTPKQDEDVLIRLCELKPGDSVLDGTLGLGADSLICAKVVGPKGRVIGVEASLPLFALVSEGLRRAPPFPDSATIEAHHGTALKVLKTLESRSLDCVVFDPMFDLPKASTPSFDMLRTYACHDPLDEQTLAEARRVARRWVVVKGGRYGQEFERLGLTPLKLTRFKPLVWARVGPS